MSQFLALASAILYGLGDFVGGVATRRMAVWRVVAWSQLIGVAVLVVGLIVVPADRVTLPDLLWGAAAGAAGIAGLAILYSALAAGSMTIVAPISGATAAAVPVAFDIVQGTELSVREWTGVALALGAVVLLASMNGTRGADPRLVGRAMLAGGAFGLFFIMLSHTSPDSGLWPLVGARSMTVPMAFLGARLVRAAALPRGRDLGMVALVGSLDMAANVAIALALQRGPLGINSVLASLYPAFTALAAVVILRERPSAREIAGVVLAVGAIIALAL